MVSFHSIADAHNDLLLELVLRRDEERPFERYWLPNLRAGNVALQVCPSFAASEPTAEASLRQLLRQIHEFHRIREECGDRVRHVLDSADVRAASAARPGLMLSIEGLESLAAPGDEGLLDLLWQLGVRMVGLGWIDSNAFAAGGGAEDDFGLTARGRDVIERLNELGMVLDLAHASERGLSEALELSEAGPVLISHGGCRAVYDTPRNHSDGQLEALAARGGLFCVAAIPLIIDPARPTIDRVVDHIEHAIAVMGNEHVALGGDFITQVWRVLRAAEPGRVSSPSGLALDEPIVGLAGPEDYPALVEALEGRGHRGAELQALLSENLLSFLERALP